MRWRRCEPSLLLRRGPRRETMGAAAWRKAAMNLILALVWFALGVGVLIWEFVNGQSLGLPLLGGLSPAWLAALLCLYNLARWYSERAYRKDMQAIREAQDQRRSHV